MRITVLALIGSLILLLAFTQEAKQDQSESKKQVKAEKTTVAAILKEPERYDKKWVQVEGTVAKLKFKTAKSGREYTVFELEDKDQSLTVFSYEHLGIKEGDKVAVTGKYYVQRQIRNMTFKNEIDASPRGGGKVEKIKKER